MPVDSVNTIDDLRSYGPSQGSADLLIVKGYWSIGDGGGGIFYLDNGSSESDDGGITIQSSAGLPGRWKRIFDGYVNIRWFGAKGNTLYILGSMDAGSNILNSWGGPVLLFPVNTETAAVQENNSVSITLQACDPTCGATITYHVVTVPSPGSVSITGSTATYTPVTNFTGIDSFTYNATDNFGNVSSPGLCR